MSTSSPSFFKPTQREPSQPKANNYQSQIIYSPRPSTPNRTIVNRSASPINIQVVPPQTQQVNCGMIHRPVSQMLTRSSFSSSNLGRPQQMVRPVSTVNERLVQSSLPVQNPQESFGNHLGGNGGQSSVLRKSGVRPTVISVERVMRPIG